MNAPCPHFAGSAGVTPPSRRRAFTLIELLVVIALIGVLTFIAVPAFKGFGQTNTLAAAQRQMQDDLALARQFAIKTRSPVFMVFFSPRPQDARAIADVHGELIALRGSLPEHADRALRMMTNVFASQHASYAFYTEHSVGDQPGVVRPRFLTAGGAIWKVLPEGVIFPEQLRLKLFPIGPGNEAVTNLQHKPVPFPLAPAFGELSKAQLRRVSLELPVLAFDAQGRCVRLDETQDPPVLTQQLRDGFVSLGLGSVFAPRDGVFTNSYDFNRVGDVVVTPKDNFTNTIYRVAGLTGRARRFLWGAQPGGVLP